MKKSKIIFASCMMLFVFAGPLSAASFTTNVGKDWKRFYWNAGSYDSVNAKMKNYDNVSGGDRNYGNAKVALDRNGVGALPFSNVTTVNCYNLKPGATCSAYATQSYYDHDDFRTAGKYTKIYSPAGVSINSSIYSILY